MTGHFSTHQSELRITVEAVDVDGNRLLWRDSIAAPTDDSLALRDQLTSLIRNGLLPALGTGAPTATHARPRNAEAYAVYLKSLAISSDPAPNREAIAMLERASSIDPDYADMWVSLADRYYYDGHYGGGGGGALRRSEASARQALALDPNYMSRPPSACSVCRSRPAAFRTAMMAQGNSWPSTPTAVKPTSS